MNIFGSNGSELVAALDPDTGPGCNCPHGMQVVQHLIEGVPIADCAEHGAHPDSPTPIELDPLAAALAEQLTPTNQEN